VSYVWFCGSQALAAVCRHVAVEVVTAAERDSPDAQPSPAPLKRVTSEQQPAGEEAHLRSGGWDAEAAVSARGAESASWLASGGPRCHRRRFQPSPSAGPNGAVAVHMAPSVRHDAAESSVVDILPSSGRDDIDPTQMSTVRLHGRSRAGFDCLRITVSALSHSACCTYIAESPCISRSAVAVHLAVSSKDALRAILNLLLPFGFFTLLALYDKILKAT